MAEQKKRIGALWAKGQDGTFFTGVLEVEEASREEVARKIRLGEKINICLNDVKQEPGKARPRYNIVINEWNKNESPKPIQSKLVEVTQKPNDFADDCPF